MAIALSAVWLLASAIFFLMQAPATPADTADGGLRFLMTMLVVFLPVGMIWVAATAARASQIIPTGRVMREESRRLQAAIDAIRHAYIAQQQGQSIDGDSSVSRKLDEIAAAARKTESTLAMFQTRRDGSARPAIVAKARTSRRRRLERKQVT